MGFSALTFDMLIHNDRILRNRLRQVSQVSREDLMSIGSLDGDLSFGRLILD